MRVCLAAFVLLGAASPALALNGRLVDQRTGAPIAGAEVTIIGETGSVRTDADGRFTWTPDPRPPFVLLVILPGGRLAKPVHIDKIDAAAVLTVTVESTVTEEVTVAAGAAPSIDTTPGAALTLLTGRDVVMRMPATLLQALENVPGVSQVSEGQAAVPAVRGLARGRTLLLVDGGRVSSERRVGPSASFLDPAVIEGVDVARGAGSVAYGSDALGGVISVRTRRPAYTETVFEASGTIGAGIPDRRGDMTLSKGFGSGGVLVSAHVRDVDDYDSPDGAVLNSGSRDAGVLVRLERLLAGGMLGGSWQGDFARDVERPRNNSGVVRFYYPLENSHRFNASFERPGLAGQGLLKLSAFFGTDEQRTDQDRLPTPTRPRDIVRADVSARDFQARASLEARVANTRIEFGTDINGRAGLEAHDVVVQYDLSGAIASESDTLSIASARRLDTAVFFQADRPLAGQVTAAGGVRVDYVRNVNEGGYFGDRTVSNGAAAGFVSMTAGPFHRVTITAQLSRGFRDPTLSDRFFRGPSGRGFVTGNPDLEPETSLQLDMSARYATERIRLAGYFYQYRIRDLVERYQTETDFFFFRNRGRAQLRGVEIEAQASLGRGYSLEASAQRGRGRSLDDDAALDDISPDLATVVVRKTFGSKASTFARLAWYGDDHRPGPSEVPAPGHTNLDVGASWTVARRLEIRGAIRNILNETYYASPDPRFVLAPGVNGFLTAKVKF